MDNLGVPLFLETPIKHPLQPRTRGTKPVFLPSDCQCESLGGDDKDTHLPNAPNVGYIIIIYLHLA